jgi:hypothetical protein
MAAGRRSDCMAPFARLYHFAGLVGSHEANCIQRRLPAKSAASRCCTRSPVTKWIRADDNQPDF